MRLHTIALLLLTACRGTGETDDTEPVDLDGDGVTADEDCNDDDPTAFPGAIEICDGIDNDCAGGIDDVVDPPTWYADGDGDGYGNAGLAQQGCDAPTGYVSDGTDCDDGDDAIHPGADESDCADPTDYNCDGSTGYADADEDGSPACEDCDDAAESINPDALEQCDEIDNDCDGTIDEDDAIGTTDFYADIDGDGYGDPADSVTGCAAPEGYVGDGKDCDDGRADVNPGAGELCDGLDQDCDGKTDEDAVDAKTFYLDADKDGAGGSEVSQVGCAAPTGFVESSDDCDDLDAKTAPGATEACDGKDNDCDGSPDLSELDADGDGTAACDGDCDDADAAVVPGAKELCNGADDDCDGKIDEFDVVGDTPDAPTWYADDDGDSYGNPDKTKAGCEAPTGYVSDNTDCNDKKSEIHPNADETDCADATDYNCDGVTGFTDSDKDGTPACKDCDDSDPLSAPGKAEVCDGKDNNCDGTVDESGATGESTFYADADGDGYGDATKTQKACAAPTGYVSDKTDCDDETKGTNPGADEICNSIDDDCNSKVDDDATDVKTWYFDSDKDGYGNPDASKTACSAPSGYVGSDTDCNDIDPKIKPGVAEIWYDDIDQNCDGKSDFDQDGDGQDSYYKNGGQDCNDTSATYKGCGNAAGSAAKSCWEILDSDDSLPSDAYWLKPAAVAYPAYCDMKTDGGGWTLVLKTKKSSATFQYNSAYWSNTTVLNSDDVTSKANDAKFQSYLDVAFKELRGCADPASNGTIKCMIHDFGTNRANALGVFNAGSPGTAPSGGIYLLPANPIGTTADATKAKAIRDAFVSVFGITIGTTNLTMKDCAVKDPGFNIHAQDNNFYRWGFSNNIPGQPCQVTRTNDADGAIGWGIQGQDAGATGAGYTNYTINDNANGGKQKSVDSWIWVR